LAAADGAAINEEQMLEVAVIPQAEIMRFDLCLIASEGALIRMCRASDAMHAN
jgi:hypothetical protein